MPGRKFARRLGESPGNAPSKRRRPELLCALACALALSVSNCRFPDYTFVDTPAGSGGGAGTAAAGTGNGGRLGGVGAGGSGGRDIGDAGTAGITTGGTAGGGSAGEAGSMAGSGGEPCLYPVPLSYPAHCFNKTAGDGESGVDCGGSECAPCWNNQACVAASDCLSKQCGSNKLCVPLISLTYTPIDTSARTPAPKFKLNITYSDKPMPLRDLRIRYYYNHNEVTEPVLGLDSQATIDPDNMQMDISTKVLTSVHRFPLGPKDANGLNTDSYLEIAFNDSTTVTSGTKLVITQNFVAGNVEQLFDQNSHYSFSKNTGPNPAIVVSGSNGTLWGVEPPMALFPDCAFASGANLNGPALTVGGEALLAESQADFTFNGAAPFSSTAKVLPSTDATTAKLLSTGRTLNTGESLVWSVPNGNYWAYAWLTSTVAADNGTLSLGDSVADKFIGSTSGGARWGVLGPYRVDVTDGSLQLTVDGSVHLAGIKLYEAER